MPKILSLCVFILFTLNLNAQADFINVEKKPVIYGCEYYKSPEENFKCMQLEIQRHIARNFRYPEAARVRGVQGKVYVCFTIDKSGNVKDVEVVKGIREKYWLRWWLKKYAQLIEEESTRVVSLLEFKEPAYNEGEAVAVMYTVPINARLQ